MRKDFHARNFGSPENMLACWHYTRSTVYYTTGEFVRTFDPMAAAARAIQLARAGQSPSFDDGPVGDIERDALAEGIPLWLEAKSGHLYLAANASWPGLYKIGCTRRSVEARMRQLSGAGVPTPWVPYQAWPVHDAHGVEALAHRACHRWMVDLQLKVRSEMFGAPAEVLQHAIEDVLAQDRTALRASLGAYLPDNFGADRG
jgi:hypothetical protein